MEWADFTAAPRGVLLANCPGGPARAVPLPARVVPVAKPYRAVIARMASERSGALVAADNVNELANTVNAASACLRGTPKVLITRLRTTWMVDRALAGVPWTDLADAAGIKLESLVRALQGHIPPSGQDILWRKMSEAVS